LHYVTAVRFADGDTEEAITSVMWLNTSDGVVGTSTVEAMVDFVDKGNVLYVGGPEGHVRVGVVRPHGRRPYIRAYANKQWVDNLRNLPRI
jgi:hypothetical protein